MNFTPPPDIKRPSPSTRLAQASQAKSKTPLVLVGIGVVVLAVAVGLAVTSMNKGPEGGGDTAPNRETSRKKPPTKKPKTGKAEKAWQAALRFAEENPQAWPKVRGRFEKALEACAGTKYEEMLRQKIEAGNAEAGEADKRAFLEIDDEARRLLSIRKFDEALDHIRKYQGPNEWMGKAIATQQEITQTKRIWTQARLYDGGSSLSSHNSAALLSFLAESDYDLTPALKGDALTGTRSTGNAAWTVSAGILTGETGAGQSGEVVFGGDDWLDYVVAFDFRIDKGGGYTFKVHARDSSSEVPIDATEYKLKTGDWYQVHAVVWGDFLVFYGHDGPTRNIRVYAQASNKSSHGGFGFHLEENAKVSFKRIRYRRLHEPGTPFRPVAEGWIPLITDTDTIVSLRTSTQTGEKQGWRLKDGVLSGASDLGNSYLEVGSPSWTEFEAKFALREASFGMTFVIQRTPDLQGQFDQRYEEAVLSVPPEAAKSSDWVEGLIVVGPEEAVLTLGGKEIARSAFSSTTTTEKILRPIRIGFQRSSAGGKLALRDLAVRVTARGGGF
ncbi:MAG: hypothetical protein ACYS47_08805 [Planctomycetota bacterium]